MIGKMSQASSQSPGIGVVPSSSSFTQPRVPGKQTGKHAVKATAKGLPQSSKPKPKQAAPDQPRKKDPRDIRTLDGIEEDQDDYVQRRKPLLFTGVVGILIIAVGAPMTWYGASQELTDFLVLGPQAIIIGSGMFFVSLAIFIRDLYKLNKRRKVEHGYEVTEVNVGNVNQLRTTTPQDPLMVLAKEPTQEELYSQNHDVRPKEKCNDELDDELDKMFGARVNHVVRPSLALPKQGSSEMNGTEDVYVVPVDYKQVVSVSKMFHGESSAVTRKLSHSKDKKVSFAGEMKQTDQTPDTYSNDSTGMSVPASSVYNIPGEPLTADSKTIQREYDASKSPYTIYDEPGLGAPVRELSALELYDVHDAPSKQSFSARHSRVVETPDTGVSDLDEDEDFNGSSVKIHPYIVT